MGMLVLSRRPKGFKEELGQRVFIRDRVTREIVATVTLVRGVGVRLGFECDDRYAIERDDMNSSGPEPVVKS